MYCLNCKKQMKPILTFSKERSGKKYICLNCKMESKIKRIHYNKFGKVEDFETN